MNEQSSHEAESEVWRAQVEAVLRTMDDSLTLLGLFWLKPGYNSVGGDAANDLVLPGSVPEHFGSFELYKGRVTFYAAPDSDVALNGVPVEEAELHSDQDDAPDLLTVGDLVLLVSIHSGRFALAIGAKGAPVRA